MLDLKRRRPDLRAFVASLEAWLIDALAAFGVTGETREDRVGVWVARPDKPAGSAATPPKTRSPPSACACAAGRRFTASRSTSRPTCRISQGIVPCGISAGASRRDEPARSRAGDDDGRGRRGAARGVRAPVRAHDRGGVRPLAEPPRPRIMGRGGGDERIPKSMTLDDFLAWEERQELRYEFDGIATGR